MKPSLALPIAVLLAGALVTQLMRTSRPAASSTASEADGRTSRLAAVGE